MAPVDPTTWTHESPIIKEDELREVAVLLGKGFRVHHPNAVGGISLSHNPNPQKYMVMHYHSVENGFRLPLHGLLRDICRHFGFAPGQLTANAHKYVASYILRCCALDKTPTLDEILILFSIGGPFPYYSLFPHPHAPIFERVEFKHDKWSHLYFVIEFSVHSPLDLPGVVLHSSISRTKFAAVPLAEAAYYALREEGGLIPHHSLQDVRLYKKADLYYPLGPDPIPFEGVSPPERSKAPPAVESNPAEISSGNQAQDNSTALAIRQPAVALEAVPISAIPGLRKPTFPLTTSSGTQSTAPAATSGGLELPNPDSLDREGDELLDQSALKRPAMQPQPEVINTFPLGATISQGVEGEADRQKEPETSPTRERERERLKCRKNWMPPPRWSKKLKSKKVLQEENARLKADGSMELAAERSRVKSLQEQIATYQRGTQDLETQFDRLRAQISILESKVSALEDKVGSLKTELVDRESRISELENSLHDAKQEGAHLNDLVIKHIEAKRLILRKLEKERQTASELRSRMGELEKTIAAHQGEVAALTTCAEALYEEGKFDIQLLNMANNANRVVFIDLTISDSSSDSSSLAFPSLGAPTPEFPSGPSSASEQSVTSPLPPGENPPCFPQRTSGDILPDSGALPGGTKTGTSSGHPGTSRPQKRRNPRPEATRLVSGARPSSQGWFSACSFLSDFFAMANKAQGKVFIDLTLSGTSSSSDDDFPDSPAQSNDMAGLNPGEFSRLYPALRLPAPSPPSPPRLPSRRIDWDSMTLQDFALYQRMHKARLGRSFLPAEVELLRESRITPLTLPRSPNDGSPSAPPAPRPGTWEDYDLGETDDSAVCPSPERRSPWRGPPPPSF
ncbi:unnamed protein product [Cuscuta campestris]|uniref:Uncharacterized protein n=1 Tax=Cuscuta campestris TaxID=132261 RepID=A0A484KJK4_9ASTE|nr:unnamed protein product [Cuscuta campestris]